MWIFFVEVRRTAAERLAKKKQIFVGHYFQVYYRQRRDCNFQRLPKTISNKCFSRSALTDFVLSDFLFFFKRVWRSLGGCDQLEWDWGHSDAGSQPICTRFDSVEWRLSLRLSFLLNRMMVTEFLSVSNCRQLVAQHQIYFFLLRWGIDHFK